MLAYHLLTYADSFVMIIHRIKIPLKEITQRALTAAKAKQPEFDYEVDDMWLDTVTGQFVIDIAQIEKQNAPQ